MQLKSKDYNLKPCAHQDALQEMRERIAAEANGPSRGKLIPIHHRLLDSTEKWPVQKQLQGLDESPE